MAVTRASRTVVGTAAGGGGQGDGGDTSNNGNTGDEPKVGSRAPIALVCAVDSRGCGAFRGPPGPFGCCGVLARRGCGALRACARQPFSRAWQAVCALARCGARACLADVTLRLPHPTSLTDVCVVCVRARVRATGAAFSLRPGAAPLPAGSERTPGRVAERHVPAARTVRVPAIHALPACLHCRQTRMCSEAKRTKERGGEGERGCAVPGEGK